MGIHLRSSQLRPSPLYRHINIPPRLCRRAITDHCEAAPGVSQTCCPRQLLSERASSFSRPPKLFATQQREPLRPPRQSPHPPLSTSQLPPAPQQLPPLVQQRIIINTLGKMLSL